MKKRSVIAIAALAAMSFQVLAATPFGITSQDISGERRLAQQQIFEGFGCHGGNQSPRLVALDRSQYSGEYTDLARRCR